MNRNRFSLNSSFIFCVAVGLILLTAVWLRLSDLDCDPPLYFDGSGQSLSTDPYQYTYHARNKILFDNWDPLNEEQWKLFQYSLVSGVAYLIFLLAGVSRFNANLTGLILSLLAIIIFTAALRRMVNRVSLLLILFLLLINQALFVYGRLPYLENSLMFWSALIFYIFTQYRSSTGGIILIGIALALAGLTGKIFGFILIVPLLGGLWLNGHPKRLKNIIILIMSSIVAALLFSLILYGGNIWRIIDYFFKQSYGLYGFPQALLSPLNFAEKFISMGNESRYYYLSPALGLGGFLGFLFILRKRGVSFLKENPPLLFLVLWLIAGQFFFSIGNYRPLRYIYFLYLPLAGLTGYLFGAGDPELPPVTDRNDDKTSIAVFFIAVWILLEQFVYSFYVEIGFLSVYKRLVWLTAIPALIISLLEWQFRFSRALFARITRNSFALFIIILAGWSFFNGFNKWQVEKSYNIKNAGIELGEILNEGAVISGPMAPALLLENKWRGMIYAVGISRDDPELFIKNPATHFAVNKDASSTIVGEFSNLGQARPVSDYWIRDANIILVRISHLTGNREAAAYHPSEFEIGRDFFEEKLFDSAAYYIERFLTVHPDNLSALTLKSTLSSAMGRPDDGLAAVEKAARLYPDNFSVLFDLAVYYYQMYQVTGEHRYLALAEESFLKVTAKNPYYADEVAAFIEAAGFHR